jgi:hypothetical protein
MHIGIDPGRAAALLLALYGQVPLRITHPRKLAGEHRVIIVSGMLGQATPPTLDADAAPIGQARAARTCLAASGHHHGIIGLRVGQATSQIRR